MSLELIVYPLVGGALIGLSSAAVLAVHGEIAGISGIVNRSLFTPSGTFDWRLGFLGGLVLTGLLGGLAFPHAVADELGRPLVLTALAGLVVGYGVRRGNGCTSGHGVCGVGRLSPRSFIATVTFLLTGMATVFVVDGLWGVGS